MAWGGWLVRPDDFGVWDNLRFICHGWLLYAFEEFVSGAPEGLSWDCWADVDLCRVAELLELGDEFHVVHFGVSPFLFVHGRLHSLAMRHGGGPLQRDHSDMGKNT